MLVFASSGLDALIKQLVNDALPELLARGERDSGPTARFRDFVREKIERDEKLAARLIAENVTAASPQSSTIQWYIRELTSNSLQSKDQVLQIASFFDIKSNVLTDDFDGLKKLFDARNEIIHEMDINFTATNRNRNQRTKKFAVESTNHLFAIAEKFLSEVDNLCSSISQA